MDAMFAGLAKKKKKTSSKSKKDTEEETPAADGEFDPSALKKKKKKKSKTADTDDFEAKLAEAAADNENADETEPAPSSKKTEQDGDMARARAEYVRLIADAPPQAPWRNPKPRASSCADRRGEPVPTRLPTGSCPRVRPSRATTAWCTSRLSAVPAAATASKVNACCWR